MKSISPHGGKWQVLAEKLPEVYPLGLRIHRSGYHFVPSPEGRTKRGDITEFSASARRRLRASMLEYSIDHALRAGLTLTVPWIAEDFTPLMDEWRECLNRFGVSFRRDYPNSSLIYRVELQQRGAPHLHALSYFADVDLRGVTDALALSAGTPVDPALVCQVLQFRICKMWRASVPNIHGGNYIAFIERGVKLELLPSMGAMMRYVCDHTSKHKQAQLGYKGKQWGIVGRSNLVRSNPESLPAPESTRHWAVFMRMLHKVTRYRLTVKHHPRWKRIPPFGNVLKGSRRSVGDYYIADDTIRRMYSAAAEIARSSV